jgi:hypothetical protein
MRQEQLTDIPPNEVGNVVGSFVSDGANKVTSEQQGDGNWTITAVFAN